MRVLLLTRTSAELPGLPSLRSSICRWEPANLNTRNQTHINTLVHTNTRMPFMIAHATLMLVYCVFMAESCKNKEA